MNGRHVLRLTDKKTKVIALLALSVSEQGDYMLCLISSVVSCDDASPLDRNVTFRLLDVMTCSVYPSRFCFICLCYFKDCGAIFKIK